MILESSPAWPSILMALVLAGDIAMSLKPMAFIDDCLTGVKLPRDWWWVLLYVKALAITGLIAGLWLPGVGVAALVGVVAYFVCAAIAHLRARFPGQAFWANCLGMLSLAAACLAVTVLA